MTVQATPTLSEPLATYTRGIRDFRNFNKVHLPFSFLGYRSFFPETTDDMYYLIWRVNYALLFRSFIVTGSRLIHPFFWFVGIAPIACDFIRLGLNANTLSRQDGVKAVALLVSYLGLTYLLDKQVGFLQKLLEGV